MCWAEHCENYRNSLTHTPDQPGYVVPEVLSLIVALLVETPPTETIISLSKGLSIVLVRCQRHPTELRSNNSLVCYLMLESYQIAHLVTKTVNGVVLAQ
jgi:hypothetical protein